MINNEYLQRVYAGVQRRNPNEPEFLQAVEEVFESLQLVVDKHPEWEANGLLERFTEPERMGGNVCMPVQYIVQVRVSEYLELPEQQKYLAARSVGRLNALLRGKNAALFGPGRWGTTTPSLGVPVNFMEISNFISISEVAYNEKGLRPELSYGSHFFQDLVEAGTLYAAIYRGDNGVDFDEPLLDSLPNIYTDLTGDSSGMEG